MMNKFIFSIAVILTAMLGQQCAPSYIEELPPHDFLEGVDKVIYIEGNIFDNMDDQVKRELGMPLERRCPRYREEITGTRLKQLRKFLLDYPSKIVDETREKQQVINLSGPFSRYDGSYTRLLIPGKKGKTVLIALQTEEEAEKFFMIVGREDRAKYMRERFLMRKRGKRDKSR